MQPLKATRITFHRWQKCQGVKDSLFRKQFKEAQHEHLHSHGKIVRADKSQAKGTKFLFVYNKIEPTESLRSEWWFGGLSRLRESEPI